MLFQGANKQSADIVDGRLLAASSRMSEAAIVSMRDGNCYAWNAVTQVLAAGETAIMVCNDNPDLKLYIESLWYWFDVPSEMDLHFPAYATWSGVAIVGANLNRSSGNVALATAVSDEVGQAAQGTVVRSFHANEVANDQFGSFVHFGGSIVLGYRNAIALDHAVGAAAYNATIIGYYK